MAWLAVNLHAIVAVMLQLRKWSRAVVEANSAVRLILTNARVAFACPRRYRGATADKQLHHTNDLQQYKIEYRLHFAYLDSKNLGV